MQSNLTVKIGADVESLTKDLNKGVKQLDNFGSQLQSLQKKLIGVFAVDKLIDFGKEVVSITAKYQKFQAVLTNTLGSRSGAVGAMAELKEFASKTPFAVDELTASFVKLVNQGFKPTMKEMTSLGDIAASQGKSFDQLTEAIIDAQTGEFERLKEFGIRASKEGDKVTFTFKGVKQQVDFTADSIRKYILSLGNAAGVSGSMASISTTLEGKISNLGDNFDQILAGIGNKTSGLMGAFLDLANSGLGALSASLNDQVAALQTEQTELNVLVGAITDVNIPTEVRKKLIDELNQKYPDFLKNLNTEKVTNEELVGRLKDVNEQFTRKIALQTAQERFKDVQEEIFDLIDEEVEARKEINNIQQNASKIYSSYALAFKKNEQDIAALEQKIVEVQAERNEKQSTLNESLTEYNKALGLFNGTSNDYFETTEANAKETDKFSAALANLQKKIGFKKPDVRPDDPGYGMDADVDSMSAALKAISDRESQNPVSGVVAETDANTNLVVSIWDVIEARDADIQKQKEHAAQMAHNTQVAMNLGSVIGEAFGEAVTGQKKFGDAMRSILPQILKMLLAEAMASIVAAGAKQGAKSGNAIIGVAAASAGAAAISSLFNRAVQSGSSTGGGGTAKSVSSRSDSGIYRSGGSDAQDSQTIAGIIKGQDLYVIFKNYERGRKYTSATNG